MQPHYDFPRHTLILDDGAMQVYIPDRPAKPVTVTRDPWVRHDVTDAEFVSLPAYVCAAKMGAK